LDYSAVAAPWHSQALILAASAAEKAAPLSTFGKLPIKEITVFKDGHAFVAHEGEMPTDEHGNVVMDYLPVPVVGTFWPYSAEKRAKLTSVIASQKRVLVERTALSVRELLEANIGAEVMIAESGTNRYAATILGVPARSAEEQAATQPPNTGERLPEKGNLILLQTTEGVKALAIDRIQDVTFKLVLELPFGPPPEVRANLNNEQQRELARLFNAPKVMHKIRLMNNSKYPLTTAPALIIRQGRVLAQGMMTYTSTSASVDLPITTAVDFQVKKSDVESKRTPDAMQENGNHYSRIDLAGKITITSHRTQPTELEISRYVLGAADSAEADGKVEKMNMFENGDYLASGDYPYWWSWYGWPYWWNSFNGIGRITWNLTLGPDQSKELGYQWHYFWR
jgi:hypothetical protein